MRRRCRDIVKHWRRRNRASQVNPKGRVYKGLGRRQPPFAMLQHRGTPPS